MSRFGPLLVLGSVVAGCATQDAVPDRSAPSSVVGSTTTTTTTTTTPGPTTVPPSTAAPTTTTTPGAAVVASTCEVLSAAPWPDRRAAIMANTAGFEASGGTGPLVDPVRAACPDDLARAEATAALDSRVRVAEQELRAAGAVDGGLVDNVFCSDRRTSLTVKNPSGKLVGAIVGARVTDLPEGPYDWAQVVWSLGSRIEQRVYFLDDDEDGCWASWSYFSADRSEVDASLPATVVATTGEEDLAVWFPDLLGVDGSPRSGAATEAGRHATEDIRDIDLVDAPLPAPGGDVHPVISATVCPDTIERRGDALIAFAYHVGLGTAIVDLGEGPVEHAGYSFIEFNAFRRGADGRWRSLASPVTLSGGGTAAGCGPIIPHP